MNLTCVEIEAQAAAELKRRSLWDTFQGYLAEKAEE